MEEVYNKIGTLIRSKRKGRCWTQEHLADLVGISTQYISRIERGIVHPSLELLYEFAKVFDCSIYEIIPSTIVFERSYLSEEIGYRLNHCTDNQKQFIVDFISWYLRQAH